jgi:hypothetical protein
VTFFPASWQDIGNRRQFFENFAKENGFDPLIPENWYLPPYETFEHQKAGTSTVPSSVITNHCDLQGIKGVLAYHNGRISRALLDLFPNIGLVESQFQSRCMSLGWLIQ